eukprot:gene7220-9247_t
MSESNATPVEAKLDSTTVLIGSSTSLGKGDKIESKESTKTLVLKEGRSEPNSVSKSKSMSKYHTIIQGYGSLKSSLYGFLGGRKLAVSSPQKSPNLKVGDRRDEDKSENAIVKTVEGEARSSSFQHARSKGAITTPLSTPTESGASFKDSTTKMKASSFIQPTGLPSISTSSRPTDISVVSLSPWSLPPANSTVPSSFPSVQINGSAGSGDTVGGRTDTKSFRMIDSNKFEVIRDNDKDRSMFGDEENDKSSRSSKTKDEKKRDGDNLGKDKYGQPSDSRRWTVSPSAAPIQRKSSIPTLSPTISTYLPTSLPSEVVLPSTSPTSSPTLAPVLQSILSKQRAPDRHQGPFFEDISQGFRSSKDEKKGGESLISSVNARGSAAAGTGPVGDEDGLNYGNRDDRSGATPMPTAAPWIPSPVPSSAPVKEQQRDYKGLSRGDNSEDEDDAGETGGRTGGGKSDKKS